MKPYDAVLLMLSTIILSSSSIETTSSGRIATKKSGCLRGAGICIKGNYSNKNELLLRFRYDPASNVLSLVIDEVELQQKQPEASSLFLSSDNFYLQEEIILTPEIVSKLELKTSIIPAGSYPLSHEQNSIIIKFYR